MLIQLLEDPKIFSFAQLYWRTMEMLSWHRENKNKTMVLGPISHKDPLIVRENLDALALQAKRLSDAGWVVVDIASYYNITERLIKVHRVSGYPFILLEDFTLPLIRNGGFSALNFRSPFYHSVGTKREYEEAQRFCIEVRHFS